LKSSRVKTVTVTGKGRITIPVGLRKKYGMREGTKVQATDTPSGLLFKPVLRMKTWAGADAGKCAYEEMTRKLDRFRARSR
jgi:AbrB family looped-hinge helix DNA binding protein